jgi:hypothetical protein
VVDWFDDNSKGSAISVFKTVGLTSMLFRTISHNQILSPYVLIPSYPN